MADVSRHLSVFIDRPAAEVYDYVVDPRTIPTWASGLAGSVELVDGRWTADSPLGSIEFAFVPRNDLGVLDHDVTMPDGQVVTNPLRVLPAGDRSEVVFTLRQRADQSDADLEADEAAVRRDLDRLKEVLEG